LHICDNQLRIEFCANISIQDGKAETVYNCIVNWLRDVGINVKRVSGIGTDGASVMTHIWELNIDKN
jgi:hypothetical protein